MHVIDRIIDLNTLEIVAIANGVFNFWHTKVMVTCIILVIDL